jgi:hypothetical protein
MIENVSPQRFVAKNEIFLVTNFFINCHHYMIDASSDDDEDTQYDIITVYLKILDNDFAFDEHDLDILDTTREAYNYLYLN